MTDLSDFQSMNKIYEQYFSQPFPTRTTFGVELAAPGMRVEIDAIAYIGK
ncbi:RidA family protein [Chloroflexota bacterium]